MEKGYIVLNLELIGLNRLEGEIKAGVKIEHIFDLSLTTFIGLQLMIIFIFLIDCLINKISQNWASGGLVVKAHTRFKKLEK